MDFKLWLEQQESRNAIKHIVLSYISQNQPDQIRNDDDLMMAMPMDKDAVDDILNRGEIKKFLDPGKEAEVRNMFARGNNSATVQDFVDRLVSMADPTMSQDTQGI